MRAPCNSRYFSSPAGTIAGGALLSIVTTGRCGFDSAVGGCSPNQALEETSAVKLSTHMTMAEIETINLAIIRAGLIAGSGQNTRDASREKLGRTCVGLVLQSERQDGAIDCRNNSILIATPSLKYASV